MIEWSAEAGNEAEGKGEFFLARVAKQRGSSERSGVARECEYECTRGYDERIRPAVHVIRNAIVVLRRRGRYVVSTILPPPPFPFYLPLSREDN